MENNNELNNSLTTETNNGFYASDGHLQPPAYKPEHRIVLLLMAALGAVFSWVLFGDYSADSLRAIMVRYGIFWGIYAVGFYYACWQRAKTKPVGWALLALSLWLTLRPLFYSEGELNLINLLVIPLVMMLNAVECACEIPLERQGGYILAYIKGWFVAPFACLGRFFGTLGSLFLRKNTTPRARAIRLGLLCGIPLALVVLALLINADAAMAYHIENLFKGMEAGGVILRLIGAIVIAALFFSFVYYMAWGNKKAKAEPYQKPFPPASVATVISLLLLVYVVFAAFQFTYLTGLKGLPEGLTYSQYAVRGFGEVCAVAAINLMLFALCVTFTQNSALLRSMLLALLGAALLLLLCAAYRLWLYVDAYALTTRRILSFWFMACLFVIIMLCAIKLYCPKLRLLRLCAGAVVALYLLLSLLNLDAIKAQSILDRADRRGELSQSDADYLRYTLSADAREVILQSQRWRETIFYDVAMEDLK